MLCLQLSMLHYTSLARLFQVVFCYHGALSYQPSSWTLLTQSFSFSYFPHAKCTTLKFWKLPVVFLSVVPLFFFLINCYISLEPSLAYSGIFFWSVVLNLLQVPGQRLVYKFHKLPYKYEPGVTRSLSYRQNTCVITEQDRKPVTTPPPQMTSGFSALPSTFIPTSTPVRKDWSWPVVPMPTRPFLWYPGSSPFKPAIYSTGSRIMFPFVDTFASLPLGLKPVEPVSPAYQTFPVSNTSIPVSVIQRTA